MCERIFRWLLLHEERCIRCYVCALVGTLLQMAEWAYCPKTEESSNFLYGLPCFLDECTIHNLILIVLYIFYLSSCLVWENSSKNNHKYNMSMEIHLPVVKISKNHLLKNFGKKIVFFFSIKYFLKLNDNKNLLIIKDSIVMFIFSKEVSGFFHCRTAYSSLVVVYITGKLLH